MTAKKRRRSPPALPAWVPDGLKLPNGIAVEFDGYWLWVRTSEDEPYRVSGKYLYFAEDPMALLKIALEEVGHQGFHRAKVNAEVVSGTEHVLCLYWKDDSRRYELSDRNSALYGVKYRWWKSDADTFAGKYSPEFLDGLHSAQGRSVTVEVEPPRDETGRKPRPARGTGQRKTSTAKRTTRK
jgi:hypothetical protein